MYLGFPIQLAQMLACHLCSKKLTQDPIETNQGRMMTGTLRCETCHTTYPIEKGILNLLAAQAPLDETSKQEIVSRDQEADIYDEAFCTPEGNLMEVTPTIEHLGPVTDKVLLDLGCGTGRITLELIKTARAVLALDYSYGSLLTLAEKCPDNAKLGLVCADITQINLVENSFHGAVSAQVLQHLKEKSARERMYAQIQSALKVGSTFVLSAYHFDLKKRLLGQPREGFHTSNIFYHNFTAGEIRTELQPYFRVQEVHPIEIQLPWVHRFIQNKVGFSRLLEHVPILNQFGDWLIAKAIR